MHQAMRRIFRRLENARKRQRIIPMSHGIAESLPRIRCNAWTRIEVLEVLLRHVTDRRRPSDRGRKIKEISLCAESPKGQYGIQANDGQED